MNQTFWVRGWFTPKSVVAIGDYSLSALDHKPPPCLPGGGLRPLTHDEFAEPHFGAVAREPYLSETAEPKAAFSERPAR